MLLIPTDMFYRIPLLSRMTLIYFCHVPATKTGSLCMLSESDEDYEVVISFYLSNCFNLDGHTSIEIATSPAKFTLP